MKNAHDANLLFMPKERTELLSGILWKELCDLIAAAKKPDAVINHSRINQVQELYFAVVKHRNKIKAVENKIAQN